MAIRIHARIGTRIVCGQANACSLAINNFRHADSAVQCKRCLKKIAAAIANSFTGKAEA